MGEDYFTNPIIFLIQVVIGTFALFAMLRFLLQAVKADFYNPLSQFIIKITNPILNPLRKIIPNLGRIDIASIIIVWLLLAIEAILILIILKREFEILNIFIMTFPEVLSLLIDIFIYGIIIQAILSWVNPGSYNPALQILYELNKPILHPIRKFIPAMSGIDITPIIAIVGLYLLQMLLIPPLQKILLNLI